MGILSRRFTIAGNMASNMTRWKNLSLIGSDLMAGTKVPLCVYDGWDNLTNELFVRVGSRGFRVLYI
jgi:hypothetical protein